MGFYNGTCAFSHLPILGGDSVVIIPILPLPHQECSKCGEYSNNLPHLGEGYTYPWDAYSPFPIPIYGEADCYGGASVEDSDEILSAVHRLTKVDCQAFCDQAGRMEDTNRRGEWCRVLILREVWDYVVSRAPNITPTNEELLDLNCASPGVSPVIIDPWVLGPMFSMEPETRSQLEYRSFLTLGILERVRELQKVTGWMVSTRRMWMPQGGMGSSLVQYREHARFAKMVSRLAGKKLSELIATHGGYDSDGSTS